MDCDSLLSGEKSRMDWKHILIVFTRELGAQIHQNIKDIRLKSLICVPFLWSIYFSLLSLPVSILSFFWDLWVTRTQASLIYFSRLSFIFCSFPLLFIIKYVKNSFDCHTMVHLLALFWNLADVIIHERSKAREDFLHCSYVCVWSTFGSFSMLLPARLCRRATGHIVQIFAK